MTGVAKTSIKKSSIFHEAALKVFPVLQQQRTQSFLIVFLTLLALIILGLFAINPTIVTIIDLNRQIADDTLVYNQLQEKIANLTTLQGEYEDLQPDLPLVLAAIPDTYQLPKLLGQVQTLAGEHDITVTSLESDPVSISTTPVTTTSPVSFTIAVKGTQDNILAFISSFNSFERITTIQKIAISVSKITNNEVDAIIQGQAFYLPL